MYFLKISLIHVLILLPLELYLAGSLWAQFRKSISRLTWPLLSGHFFFTISVLAFYFRDGDERLLRVAQSGFLAWAFCFLGFLFFIRSEKVEKVKMSVVTKGAILVFLLYYTFKLDQHPYFSPIFISFLFLNSFLLLTLRYHDFRLAVRAHFMFLFFFILGIFLSWGSIGIFQLSSALLLVSALILKAQVTNFFLIHHHIHQQMSEATHEI